MVLWIGQQNSDLDYLYRPKRRNWLTEAFKDGKDTDKAKLWKKSEKLESRV